MWLIIRIKNFFMRLFCKPSESVESDDTTIQPILETIEEVDEQDNLENFKTRNKIYEKLDYLEQYIKIFSLPFPNEYSYYLEVIKKQRIDYETELTKYSNGLLGELTFAMDPECESSRHILISNLETEITDFVELVVNYSIYKEKFSKLCLKLNQFYNALLDTKRATSVIESQLNNAISSMHNLLNEVQELRFFKEDSRKKESLLNHIIYGEYIFLKSFIRCGLTEDFYSYKRDLSKFHYLFVDSEYDKQVFKFFIEDLEHYQNYINSFLTGDKISSHIMQYCQDLQNSLNNYQTIFGDSSFFAELVKFENTIDNISENNGMEFVFSLPKSLDVTSYSENSTNISVKDTAISLLSMLNSNKSKILLAIVQNFKEEISWREFYFLCKIFELYDDIIKISVNTIFSFVHTKFLEINAKYPQYSDYFIKSEKLKLLLYHGSKKKKYIFLFRSESEDLPVIVDELELLALDFLVSENNIYLNYSYFNGFKNLEKNFGQYKLSEEI